MNSEDIKDEQLTIEHPDYVEDIKDLLDAALSMPEKKEKISDFHESTLADALEELDAEDRSALYLLLDDDTLAEVLTHTDENDTITFFNELSLVRKVDVLSEIDVDEASDMLEELDAQSRHQIMSLMDDDTRRELALINSYDDDEVGNQMTTDYIRVIKGVTIRQAMRALVEQAAEYDNISTIYVVKPDQTFYGAIDLKDLIRARRADPIEDIIMTNFPFVYAHEKIEDCIERIKDLSEDIVPVLDEKNKLIGVLTAADIMELYDEEMGEDYAKLGGLTGEEDLEESLKDSIAKRLPWLLVLLCLALVVSSVVGMYEHVIASVAFIVSFQSLVQGMSGNVGTQSLAVTIRVLMDEELTAGDKLRMVFKEARVGLTNGLILGTLAFVAVGVFIFVFKGQDARTAFTVSLCVGVALVVAMLLASITGTVIPIFFKKINIDPAVASGPLITTFNDLVAVITYYSLAWLFLIKIMGM